MGYSLTQKLVISSKGMKLFVLEPPYDISEATTNYTIVEPSKSGPASRCQECGEYVEMLHWLPPHRVEIELLGKDPGDFVYGGPIDVLVSERLRDLYQSAHLSGFEGFDPVQVVKIKRQRKLIGGQIPNYYHVRVGRSSAKVNDKASGIRREEGKSCSECGGGGILSANRIVLEEGTWSGEDAFYARGLPGIILVTSRFAEVCSTYRLKGAVLTPALEYRYERYGFLH